MLLSNSMMWRGNFDQETKCSDYTFDNIEASSLAVGPHIFSLDFPFPGS